MVKVIGIMGPRLGGKSTISKFLIQEHGFVRMSMADPLKQMLMTLGLGYEYVYGDKKEQEHPILCGKTARWAMQSLGTEWGRDLIGGDIWVNAMRHRIESSGHNRVVIDDIRFENEVVMVRSFFSGSIWRVIGRGVVTDAHVSEALWMEIAPDEQIFNGEDVTLDQLKNIVAQRV